MSLLDSSLLGLCD